jgi:hypothetical protein
VGDGTGLAVWCNYRNSGHCSLCVALHAVLSERLDELGKNIGTHQPLRILPATDQGDLRDGSLDALIKCGQMQDMCSTVGGAVLATWTIRS